MASLSEEHFNMMVDLGYPEGLLEGINELQVTVIFIKALYDRIVQLEKTLSLNGIFY